MKIAVIGLGVAGISVLRAMARDPFYYKQEITVYDAPPTMGTGLPYQPDSELLLLNQTADTMSLHPDDPLEFVEWVEKRKGLKEVEKAHLPRPWYGEYLQDLLHEACTSLNVTRVLEQVQDVEVESGGKLRLQTASSKASFDLVHLCMGHLPYQDPYGLLGQRRYIHHPYPVVGKLDMIPDGARVGIIGTGLTAVDVLLYLKEARRGMVVSLMSDTGTFSTLRGREPKLELRYLNKENLQKAQQEGDGFVPLEQILDWFRQECREQGVDWRSLFQDFGTGDLASLRVQLEDERDLGRLQAILHQMDSYLADYWLALTEADKELFLKEYQGCFEMFRSPLPRETVRRLLDWQEHGELEVRGGMESVQAESDSFLVRFQEGKAMEFDYLVNATGQQKEVRVSRYNSPLLTNLLNKRILLPEPFGGVVVTWPDSSAVSQRYGVLGQLVVHGQSIEGIQYGNNTARTVMEHASAVVQRLAGQPITY